jgi:hypothetical protein
MINDPRLPANFWSKVTPDETGCWIWTGAISRRGYGQFAVNQRTKSTHRLAYTVLAGEIPNGLQIDHLCHNPSECQPVIASECKHRACCNPDHLEPVTSRVNIRRAMGLPDHAPEPAAYAPSTRPAWVPGSDVRNYLDGLFSLA